MSNKINALNAIMSWISIFVMVWLLIFKVIPFDIWSILFLLFCLIVAAFSGANTK